MSQTFSGTNHLSSGAVAATAVPLTLVIWLNTTLGQFKRFISLANSTDNANVFNCGTDVTSSSSNLASAYVSITGNNAQALSSTAMTASTWQHLAAVFASTSSRAIYINGANKGSTGGGPFAPTGINATIISGRASDFTAGIVGQAAQAAVWNRALSDNEVAHLGAGGNPRAIKGCVSYWKIASGESPVVDQIGTNNLTVTGTSAGTTDPSLQTYMTGGPVGALSYTQGTAITAIDLTAGGATFDNVSSAFTATLQQLSAPSQPTTTSSALTAVREVVVGSVGAFSAGDYMKVTSGGTPTRVLGVNVSTNTLLVAADQTYSTSAQVFRFAVNPLTVSGLSISSNSFSGTPTSAGVNSLCLFRATCNALGTLMADSDVFTVTVASGGGGGGGGLQMPAGAFCGGFVGG